MPRCVRGTKGTHGPFGRTIAQPMRRSGWRPFTSHSKARGTSGTMPGKRCAISGGGVPADVHVGYLVREGLDHWRQEGEPARARLPYGDPALQKRFAGTAIGQWANAVVVLERGSVLWAEKGARAQSDSTPPAAEVAGRRPPLPV